VATAVVMASHARLGAKSLLRTLLVELEPQLVQLIVLDGALRGARGAAAQESYVRELCVSFLQLGCCPNGEACHFSHQCFPRAMVKGGGQLPPGFVFERDELRYVGARHAMSPRTPPAPAPLSSTLRKLRQQAGAWRNGPLLGGKPGVGGEAAELQDSGGETSAFCFRVGKPSKASLPVRGCAFGKNCSCYMTQEALLRPGAPSRAAHSITSPEGQVYNVVYF